MLKSAAALAALVLCTALLAACGDSDSGSSATKTATVPTGKLGDTAAVTCTPTRISGMTIHALTATNVSCDVAVPGLNSVMRTNKYAGWTCSQSISGRNVRVTCTKDGDASQRFSGSWSVA